MKTEFLFNIWIDGQHSKTTVRAANGSEALDIFCARHGFVDHADYCQVKGSAASNIYVERVDR